MVVLVVQKPQPHLLSDIKLIRKEVIQCAIEDVLVVAGEAAVVVVVVAGESCSIGTLCE